MIRLADAAKYDQGLARQKEAWQYLFKAAPPIAWDALQSKVPGAIIEEFARRFRVGTTAKPIQPALQQVGQKILPAPYYSQRDNYRDADRTCFSSTCAMALKALKPGVIKTDDDYIRTVFSIGDTTSITVQIQALKHYGIEAVYSNKGTFDTIRGLVNRGLVVPIGWLHRGVLAKPQPGGHWSLVIGYTTESLIIHDPWGKADLIKGATLSSNGEAVHYPYKHLGPRWMVQGNDGWYLALKVI